jgi:hypothetical protein
VSETSFLGLVALMHLACSFVLAMLLYRALERLDDLEAWTRDIEGEEENPCDTPS